MSLTRFLPSDLRQVPRRSLPDGEAAAAGRREKRLQPQRQTDRETLQPHFPVQPGRHGARPGAGGFCRNRPAVNLCQHMTCFKHCFWVLKGDVSETVRMFFDDSKAFPPAAKSLLTIQEVDSSLSRLAQLTKEDEQQNELEAIAKK